MACGLCRLALQQQRAAGGTKLAERNTTNERLARRQEALRTHFSVDDPNDSGGIFLSAEDAEQLRQRSPVVASPQLQPSTTQGRLGRRRFDEGGELASNAIGVAQIRQARRDRAAGLAPPPVGAAEASAPSEGAAKLTQRAKMLREQRQQVPLSERKTTNADAEQRAALRKEAYAQFTEGGGSVFMSDGAVPQELLDARKAAEERENEAKERRRAALATFSANDAHVFLHDHNIPQAMRGDGVPPPPLRERAESDPPGAISAVSPAVSDRGGARQRLRRRLSSTASSNGSGGGGVGAASVAERAKAMRMARQQHGGSEVPQIPPACEEPLPHPDSAKYLVEPYVPLLHSCLVVRRTGAAPLASSRSTIAARTHSGSSSPAILAHTVAMQR